MKKEILVVIDWKDGTRNRWSHIRRTDAAETYSKAVHCYPDKIEKIEIIEQDEQA